ncbi:TPA: hypothetical protein VPG36_001008 [Streptococcus pyogenes]|jgi:hypothetical protein|nr:hypothetical protein [Streptococcus pyogenes]
MGGRGARIMSRGEFLAQKGLASPLSGYLDDKMRGNRSFSSGKQREKFTKEARKNIDNYHDRRNEAIREYNSLISSGKIKVPTQIQKSMRTAHGHPDNRATQAARRMLTKRGYDWKTGKKLKG